MTTTKTCKNCGKEDLVSILVEGKHLLFRKGPASRGVNFFAHVCKQSDIDKFRTQLSREAYTDTLKDYRFRVLIRHSRGKPVWYYCRTSEEKDQILNGQLRKRYPNSRIVKVEVARWLDITPGDEK